MSLINLFEQLLQDLRYALRIMAAQPLFTAMAALSLALGIGANTAIYSFMDAILLRALPVQNPESLVVLNWHSKDFPPVAHRFSGSNYGDPKTGMTSGNFPYPAFELLRDNNQVLSSVFAFSNAGRLNVQIHGLADIAASQYVSGAFFSGLGMPPAVGRLIDATDDRMGAAPVAVLSFGYAQRRFGDIAAAVGQSILINDNAFTIAGVAAPEFFGVNPGGQQDLYVPLHASALLEKIFTDEQATKYLDRNFYWAQIMGRLRPGVTMTQAQAALAPGFQQFVRGTAVNDNERADMPALLLQEGAGGLDSLRRQYSKPLYVLMTLVGLILAIACANMANLLLARATTRRREIAVRLSMGAGRVRLIRQLLTESILLASLGGVLGLAIAKWGIGALTLLIANGRDNFSLHAGLNWHVLAVTIALSVGTGILFGLAPALQSTRVDLVSALKQTRAGEHRLRLHAWLRVSLSQVLAVSQIAISLLLLVAAGLFVHTLTNLNSIALGFNSENLLLVTINARQAGYKDDALTRFYHDLEKRLRGIPGVRAASLSSYALVSGSMNSTDVHVAGESSANNNTTVLNVGSDFFSTMQIPVLLGREIQDRDILSPSHVAVVNELFVQKYLGGANPLGRHFQLGRAKNAIDFEIIGVSKTTRHQSLKRDTPPVAFVPYSQNPRQSLGQMVYELRAAGDPMALATSARQIVQQADARIPISNIVTQARTIDQTIGQERTFAMLCTCFAVLAVLIACVGLYGMMAYRVARRTNEIGIRMALGAERRRLVWMILREVLVMAVLGLAIGLPAAFATTRFVQSFLFQIKPNDPLAITLAACTLLAAALLAGYGPARRASRVDPWQALRDE
jgi:macrolide transport system ATP-binding/permease protein